MLPENFLCVLVHYAALLPVLCTSIHHLFPAALSLANVSDARQGIPNLADRTEYLDQEEGGGDEVQSGWKVRQTGSMPV